MCSIKTNLNILFWHGRDFVCGAPQSGYNISNARRPNGEDILGRFSLILFPYFPAPIAFISVETYSTKHLHTRPGRRRGVGGGNIRAYILLNIRKYIILSSKSFSFDSFTTLLSRKNTIKSYNVFQWRLINCQLNNNSDTTLLN